MEKSIHYKKIGWMAIFISSLCSVSFGDVRQPECIVPGYEGGGFERTCELIQNGFADTGIIMRPIRIVYMPGKVGYLAYEHMVTDRNNDANAIVAFSTGTLLNIAQGNFGEYDEHSVRWLAGMTLGYGALFVRTDAKIRNMNDFVSILKTEPKSIVIGMSGGKGNQNWAQMAVLADVADFDMKNIKYHSINGANAMIEELFARKIDVMSANVVEMMPYVESGDVRVLAIFADDEASGILGQYPTARDQGYDVVWPVIRGVYMGADVSDEDYGWWKEKFDELSSSKEFIKWREKNWALPLAITGKDFERLVYQQIEKLRELSDDLELGK